MAKKFKEIIHQICYYIQTDLTITSPIKLTDYLSTREDVFLKLITNFLTIKYTNKISESNDIFYSLLDENTIIYDTYIQLLSESYSQNNLIKNNLD